MSSLLRRFAQLRAIVLVVIALTLGSGGMLPVWAQMAGVEGPHVCHCSTDHHDCVCAHCGTDHDGKAFRGSDTLKGRCGDDEVAFGGRGFVAVLPAALAAAPSTTTVIAYERHVPTSHSELRAPPPTPPPRSA